MGPLGAIMYREGKIRATNVTFIFWDLFYPLGYLLVFGVGIDHTLGFTTPSTTLDYNAFFLAGVLGMASFGIASNTSWSFFLDRDNGILFASSMFYPLEPLPRWFRVLGYANPITWHVDVLRYLTVGVGESGRVLFEATAFALFVLAGFTLAIRSLEEA